MIGATKLTHDDVDLIRDLLTQGKTHQSIGDMFGVSREHITAISKGRRWNKEKRSFLMKEEIKSNDFREFTEPQQRPLPIRKVELVEDKDQLDLDQKYYLVKFIESLTGKKIKKMIIEF